jgi:hypothetical protein
MDACHPASEIPYCPTRPLWFGTFFKSHSMVSYVSVLSLALPEPLMYGA